MGSMSQELDRLWAKYRPEMEERIAVLEAANRALAAGELSAAHRSAAGSAAHKLAGVLGTFGLHDGTARAREAEQFYSGDDQQDPPSLARMIQITEDLKTMIVARSES